MTLLSSMLSAGEPQSLSAPVDESLYMEAYGMPSSERLMYPVDMVDWPLRITSERQLFVDDFLVASSSRLTRELHQPNPYSSNPILRLYENPWEHGFGHSVFVLRDEKSGKFRMWYNLRHFFKGEDGLTYRAPTCYAESDDGIH